jgi:hydrogenase nickel incorporation protein HypB
MKIVTARKILKANDQIAAENRGRFDRSGTLVVNMVGSPGCGKTTLLEALFAGLDGRVAPAVIEGDLASSVDAERIEKLGVPVVQINTQGACHLDALMVADACEGIALDKTDLLVIENVGNLVCTAGFDLGEHLRIVLLSVSEGDDKVIKYPTIFRSVDALLITKTDLLPQSDFRVDRVRADMKRLAPAAQILPLSARSGEGVQQLAEWLSSTCSRPR